MTIEEYLKISAEEIENTIPKGDNCDGNIYLAGKVDAYREILEKLPEMEHEVTLREIHEMCLEHDCNCISKDKECCLRDDGYCMVNDVSPNNIGVDEIERRMKEARND